MVSTSGPTGPFTPLTDDARAASLGAALAARPAGEPLRLFAYAALIWRPCFDPVSAVPGAVFGYRKRFCVWTVEARGTPERPGLGLGLEAGSGSAAGLVLQMPETDQSRALAEVWAREMWTGIYRPRWVAVRTDSGRLRALTFVVDPDHPQYAGGLDEDEQARLIEAAAGVLGSCRDYLESTVAALERAGLPEPDLARLASKVADIARRRAG